MSVKQPPALVLVLLVLVSAALSQPSPPQGQLSPAEIDRLVAQLGSSSYADREAAAARLKALGKAAEEALRRGALSKDPEMRRRAGRLLDELLEPPFSKALKEGVALLNKKDYRKAVPALKQAAELYEKSPRPGREPGDEPLLADIYLHLARAHHGLAEYEAAGRAYSCAEYHASSDREKRAVIEREWAGMIRGLLATWEGEVRDKVREAPPLKALTEKYPLVILHSRRYASGGYGHSAYSFVYETADEARHKNDVQLLFDNGNRSCTFELNMMVGQQNLVVDLGRVDFTRDPDPRKLDPDSDTFWVPDGCKAVEGHVYLERIRDSRGNKFYILFQCLAVEKGQPLHGLRLAPAAGRQGGEAALSPTPWGELPATRPCPSLPPP
jgi:tetratricopeptide (TPR) repeat protein